MTDSMIKRVIPRDKLTTRLAEVQGGVRASTVIGGRGIRVTETPDGQIVETAPSEEVDSVSSSSGSVPLWG